MKKTLCVLLISAILCSVFSGCFDRREIDDLTYVIAMGIDKGETSTLRFTIQYAIPIAMGGGGEGGSGGGGSEAVSTLTVECPSLLAGINMINNSVGKQVSLAHAKVMVFSEELARSGSVSILTRAVTRIKEFRPNLVIAIARGTAEEYLKSIQPKQEADPSKYYELKFNAYKYTGFSDNTELHDFHIREESYGVQPVAALVGVNKKKSIEDLAADNSTAAEKDRSEKPSEGDYLAGDLPRVGDIQGETMGLAVFCGPTLVGELDGNETTRYLMVTGKYRYAYVTFPDPQKNNSIIVLNLKQSRNPIHKIEMVGDKPHIKVEIRLEADFMSIQSGINYESSGLREIFEQSAEAKLGEEILNLLNKTAKEMRSDIFGFGNEYKYRFLTWDDWQSFEWLKKYKDAAFDVVVDVKVRRPGLSVRNSPFIGPEGEEVLSP